MKRLGVYLKPYTLESILGPLFKLLEALLELLVPLVVADIIDTGIGAGDTGFIVKRCLLLIGLGLLGLSSSVTAQYFAAKAAIGFTASVRHALFGKVQSLSYAELDKLGTSTLMTRMTSDMNQVQTGLNLALRLLLRSPFVVFGAMIMAFTIDVKSAWVFAVIIPLLFAVVFGIMFSCIPLYKKVQGRLDGVLGAAKENLAGVRVIRAFGKERQEVESFEEKSGQLLSSQLFVGKISALLNPVTYVMINLAIIAVLRVGGGQVYKGILTQGQVLALYNYMSQILVELIKMANLILSMTKATASAKRVAAILALESSLDVPQENPEEPKAAPAVEFDGVTFTYPTGGAPALSDISFTLEHGKTLGIIGGTGSGKSTLIGLIPRFYDVQEGCVKVDGCDVRQYPLETLRRKIGLVPQKALLFKGTIRENLLWGDENAADDAIYDALKAAQAQEVVDGKPEGLDYEVETGGRNFSGGQRQRLTIARALVRKPEVLILDDSASALDFATDAALRHALRELPWKPVVVIISQRTASIRFADEILVLDDGKLAGRGTHDELLQTCEVYREIYESQFKKEDAR
ncbi:Heterodimeric efflux ABC transporter, permease/ATP-binding subunit 1 [Oscillospiraceae bacterium]|nr:Heterodimeric efflux ABC transporter, permease/ATP-binding subunit 1 [Oscillospiraceae bacterium]